MRSTCLGLAAVVMGLALVVAPAQADFVTDDELTLTDGGGFVTGTSTLSPAGVIGTSDAVTMTGSFTGGDAIEIDGTGASDYLFIGLMTDDDTFFSISDVVVTLDLLGGGTELFNGVDTTSFGDRLGVVLSDFLGDGETITFTGYSVSFEVDSIAPNPTTYTQAKLTATNATVIPAAVPEPEAYASFAIGAMVLGLGAFYSMRRKQELAVA